MLERYQRFDVARMLAEHPANKAALKNLKRQLESMDGVRGIRYGQPTGKSQAGLEQLVIRRADLAAKIEDYEKDINLIEDCLKSLTDEELTIIREFFWMNQSRTAAAVRLAESLHLERSAIYERRAAVLKKLTLMLFG